MAATFQYHVLLIGCDKYPAEQRSLQGCVNDIDAIECLLLDAPGVGVPAAQIRLTRLAAPHEGAQSPSHFLDATRLPTRANVIAALQALAGDAVQAADRVLIYYSGHGGQLKRIGMTGWHECLVACDNLLLFDQELNALVAAIARRTSDVTIVLDCCHSAGATRAFLPEPAHGATRAALLAGLAEQAPDPALADAVAAPAGAALLQTSRPGYIAIAACQADERAQEDRFEELGVHGFLTYGLLQVLGGLSAEQRSAICWGHLWPRLLDEIERAAVLSERVAQHPWAIGQPARRVFGGNWAPRDAGYPIQQGPIGALTIEAGQLLGFDVGAEVGIYGPEPAYFPESDSATDLAARIGTARVTAAARATCVAFASAALPTPLPAGARARMLRPTTQQRLRVWLDRATPDPAEIVAHSELLELVETQAAAELWVARTPQGWALSNDLNREFATLRLPAGQGLPDAAIRDVQQALRAGLNAYASYNAVLRLARRCNDRELDQALRVTMLDCSDAAALAEVNPKAPALPELARGSDNVYQVAASHPFCIRITNTSLKLLAVTVLNCTAGGKVEHLGTVGINGEDTETIWYAGIHREPFLAVPDNPQLDTIDRIIAIGTTRAGTDLGHLKTEHTIQQLFDTRERGTQSAPATSELWTASIRPLRMLGQTRL